MSEKCDPSDEELMEDDQWDFESAELRPGNPDAGVLFEIRFSDEEQDLIDECAEREGKRVTRFIHDAAVEMAERSAAAAG